MNNLGFSYLLKSLNISPSKMAKELNVDRTLVSKWKNGSRKIDLNAIYFDNAISFLINRNIELKNNFLENLFSSIYNESINHSNYENHLRELLKKFIIDNYNKTIDSDKKIAPTNDKLTNNSLYMTNISIYNTQHQSFLGIIDMLDLAINYGSAQKFFIVFNKTFDSFIDKKEIRNDWLERVIKLLDMGCSLELIYSLSKSSKLLSYLAPVLFHKNCKSSYFIDSIDDTQNYSLHIIENKSVFYSSSQHVEYETYNYGALFTDPFTINFYIAFTKNILSKSFSTFFSSTIYNVLDSFELNNNKLNKELTKYNTTYYCNTFPIYTAMSEELYYEVLCNSVSNKEDIDKYFEYFKLAKKDMHERSNLSTTHFYSIDSLINFSVSENIVYESESDISPKLILTKHQFKQHLNYLANYLLSTDAYNICLISETTITDNELFYCWCKKNEFIVIFNNNNLSDIKISTEISYVNSIFNIFEKYFLLTGENFKNKNIIANFLRSL
ncbi:MAG: helix-turn-helix transcriptional regulator [Clostridium sp.]|uniref:helix-turn-helix domain-containing protein n=1 Tax=Clostridium sp. TaxID=1506 RepID=UPI00290942FA|nr:helix-turn-helix transcriptional regulator [Clostridium sp.]MDU5109455.1 helix-turn-helix transcriptional regulator [Clostridium sp.]